MGKKVVRIDVQVSPSRLLDALEHAQTALAHGNAAEARAALTYAVTRLQAVRHAQDAALDEAARTPEPRAQREHLPQDPGSER